ncbi:MAG: hypothetical protein ACK5L5_03160 [Bacteroidales bacterium]
MKYIISAYLAVLLSVYYTEAQGLTGVYTQDEMSSIKLYISEELFLLEDESKSYFNCSDTIAFGYWYLDESNVFMKLYTDPLQYASLANIAVEESSKHSSKDSIYIYIQNPIEDMYDSKKNKRTISYKIYVSDEYFHNLDIGSQVYHQNEIFFPKPAGFLIESIRIEVYPDIYSVGWRFYLSPYMIETLPYKPANPEANVFKIDIPKLTACYINSLRLQGDFVKILNDHQLEWDGKIYTKKTEAGVTLGNGSEMLNSDK